MSKQVHTVAELIKRSKVNPKIARRRLRNAKIRRSKKDGWNVVPADRAHVFLIIKGAA